MSVAELDVHFYAILLEVQKIFASIILDSVNMEESYSVYRSLRWGATSEDQNVRISEIVINSNNRWQKLHHSKGMRPGWSMMQNYTDAQVAIPMLIKFLAELPS